MLESIGSDMKKLILAALGLVLALVWMANARDDRGDYEDVGRLPAVVFGGGAGTLSVEVSTNQPGELRATFAQWDDDEENETGTRVSEPLSVGMHTHTVDVGADTYLYVEIEIPKPTVGATLSWTVSLDGEKLFDDERRLDEPLQDGYAFSLQLEADDIEELRSQAEDPSDSPG